MSEVTRDFMITGTDPLGCTFERDTAENTICHCIPKPGSLAEKIGIRKGDAVLAVAGEEIVGLSPDDIVAKVKASRAETPDGIEITVCDWEKRHDPIVEHFLHPTQKEKAVSLKKEAEKAAAEEAAKAGAVVEKEGKASKATLPPPTESLASQIQPPKEATAREQCSAFTSRTCGMPLM